jgi:glycosyltransferase involved in cell wall biosynthesis
MNILYITNHLNIGGITSYVLTLSRGLKLIGHNVYIASSKGVLIAQFIDYGIVYIPLPISTKQEVSPKIFISALKLSSEIKKYNIDIVHSNSRTTQVVGCLLEKFSGIAHISTCHGFFKKRLFRKIFPCWGQRVIAISESVKEHLINDFKVDEKKIDVIHNGIDIDKFKNQNSKIKIDIKKELGLGDRPVIGIVARLSDVKGHVYLIEAMRDVINALPEAQLLIVGDGKMRQELINLTRSIKIEKNVHFIPSVKDTRDVLSALDVFVMPSIKEGLGLALMEAMAFGLAVIGSDVGGIKTLIQGGYNGLLISRKDSPALSKAILELLKNPQKRKTLGDNAKVFISQNFSQEKMARETEQAYLKCIKQEN